MPRRKKRGSDIDFRKLTEERLRAELEEVEPGHAEIPPEIKSAADAALASVDTLKAQYLRNSNPICVWDAILQLHLASRALGCPLVLPPWVLAYLANAALLIMGKAIRHPEPTAAEAMRKDVGGDARAFSDFYDGLRPEDRPKIVLEALGFATERGRNPLLLAHRNLISEERELAIEAQRRQGKTKAKAVQELQHHDPALAAVDDPHRKLRYERQRRTGKR